MYAKAISSELVIAINVPYLIWSLQGMCSHCTSILLLYLCIDNIQFSNLAAIHTSFKSSTPTLLCSIRIKLGYQMHHSVPKYQEFV